MARNQHTELPVVHQIWYKNYEGKWVADLQFFSKPHLKVAKDRLAHIRQHEAINGKADIFRVQ